MKFSDRLMYWIDRHYLPASVALWLAMLVLLSLLGVIVNRAHAQTAPSVTLTASPTSGVSPLSVTLTWSSTGLPADAVCTASGMFGWTGTKAASGSQTIAGVRGDSAPMLACVSTTGSATVNWTLPTTNTDGSLIGATPGSVLAGVELFTARTNAGLATAPLITQPATATTYTFAGLPVGENFYGVRVFNVDTERSALVPVNSMIVAPSVSASASVDVRVRPNPPLVTVATTAYELRLLKNGNLQFVAVGTVPLGAVCDQPLAGAYSSFEGATISKPLTGGIIAARCRAI